MKRIRNRIIKNSLHRNHTIPKYPDITTLSSIAYIFKDTPADQAKHWKSYNANVKISYLTYYTYKRPASVEGDLYKSDLNFWGLPNKTRIRDFISQPFDILINMADTDCDPATCISALSNAKFKISSHMYDTLYDLVIPVNITDHTEITPEIIKALRNLKPIE